MKAILTIFTILLILSSSKEVFAQSNLREIEEQIIVKMFESHNFVEETNNLPFIYVGYSIKNGKYLLETETISIGGTDFLNLTFKSRNKKQIYTTEFVYSIPYEAKNKVVTSFNKFYRKKQEEKRVKLLLEDKKREEELRIILDLL